jgi:hypothetical protein
LWAFSSVGLHPAAGDRYFGLPGAPAASVIEALPRLLRRLGVLPPAGFRFSGHSARIGAFTESCLAGLPLRLLLALFDWVSGAMANVYFDRRMRLSPASQVFSLLFSIPQVAFT